MATCGVGAPRLSCDERQLAWTTMRPVPMIGRTLGDESRRDGISAGGSGATDHTGRP